MKKLSIYLYLIIFLLINSVKSSFAIDSDIQDMINVIDGVQEEIKELDESKLQEAIKIDAAVEEINKVTEFVKESLVNNDKENAIKALEFIEKSLTGAGSLIPQEFSSDMSKADMSSFGEDNMKIVNEITGDMKVQKEEKLSDLVSDMMVLGDKGLDSFGITENLNTLGIEIVKLDIALKKREETDTWTKEQWAASWKGDILTDDGTQVISDEEIPDQVLDLEKELQENYVTKIEGRISLSELQSKTDPLNLEINTLNNQKIELLAKYNEELSKQTSNTLTDAQIAESKKIAGGFNSELALLTDKLKTAETKSLELSNNLNNLNLELTNDLVVSTNLSSQINSLNNELNSKQVLISKTELELDQLKKAAPNINQNINDLNKDLARVALERDFIQVDFEKSIDKEVEALKYYARVLGDTEEEIDFAMREVGVILDADPRKARAFELEKYATYAGFSKDQIQKGIDAVNNDDWDTQKEVFKNITKGLSKNPNWEVDVPSDAEFNVMIEEEKVIQAAVFQSMELEKVKEQVQNSINEKTKNIQPLVGLNTTWIQYSNLQSNVIETDLVVKEMNEILKDNQQYQIKKEQIDNLQKTLDDLNNNASKYKADYDQRITQATQSFNNIETQIRQHNQNSNWGNSSWVSQRRNLYDQRVNLFNAVREPFDNKKNQVFYEKNKIELQISSDFYSAQSQARENIVKKVEEAEIQYNSIVEKETQALKEIQSKVANTLKEVPTFEANADLVSDLDPTMLRAKLSDITSGSNNEVEALEAARKAMSEIGDEPVSQYMTGPYWEMTNVKAAAIVRAKRYDYVDDYAYYNSYYEGPLNLTSTEVEEAERELSKILGKNNPKLDALNEKIVNLSSELEVTKKQSLTINDDFAKLDNELKTLKTTEKELNSQITDLTKEFTSRENLLSEKRQSLADIEGQLNPINDEMKSLDTQRAELNTKLDQELNTISNQIETQGAVNAETKALKDQFESQIAEIDNQLLNYNKESNQINEQLTSLTSELGKVEKVIPEIRNHITKLNNELRNVIDIKANLAMRKAANIGIEINKRIIDSVAKLENKSVIQVEGTKLMRIVDTETLTNEAGNFKSPEGTFTRGSQVYLAGAATRQQLFSVGVIDETGDLKISVSKAAAEKINSGVFGLETAKGMVATDNMGEGVYTLIDPKTGRQVMNSDTGNALYGGIICSGEGCGPGSDLGKQVAAKGYVFVKQGDMDQGTMCTGGDCVFNVPKSELDTFSAQVDAGIDPSAYGYNDTLAASFVNTKGLVEDKSVTEAVGTVTQEFYSGKFNVVTDVGGQEALIQKAQEKLARIVAQGGIDKGDAAAGATAAAQVAAEQSVLAAVQAAKAVASEAAQAAAAATTEVAQEAAQQVAEEVRAAQNVNQLIQYADGSIHHLVGKTGVNVSAGQTVIWSGLTSESHSSYGTKSKAKAIEEASKATGIDVEDIYNPD